MHWEIYSIDRALFLLFTLHRKSLSLALKVVRAFLGGGAPRVKLAVSVFVDMMSYARLCRAIGPTMGQLALFTFGPDGPRAILRGLQCPECLLSGPSEPAMRTS